jgi:hypothetical protein
VAEFQYKTGYARTKKTVGMETLNTHFFTNGIYFVQKNWFVRPDPELCDSEQFKQ